MTVQPQEMSGTSHSTSIRPGRGGTSGEGRAGAEAWDLSSACAFLPPAPCCILEIPSLKWLRRKPRFTKQVQRGLSTLPTDLLVLLKIAPSALQSCDACRGVTYSFFFKEASAAECAVPLS